VDIVGGDVLLEESVIRELSTQLHHMVDEGNHRLLLNFGAVRYISSQVLGSLAAVHQRLKRAHGASLGLCGLDPVMRHMMRICQLDQVFDIRDEGRAMGDRMVEGDRP
jgi:anti-anti-sigma factor